MGFKVKINHWHAVANWTWNAGKLKHKNSASTLRICSLHRTCFFHCVIIPRLCSLCYLFPTSGDDVCGICRAPFDGNPPEANFPGDDAPVVWGVCSHAFHIQCINKWLSSQPEQKCPFCRRAWEFKQAETGENRQPQQQGHLAMGMLPNNNNNNNQQ